MTCIRFVQPLQGLVIHDGCDVSACNIWTEVLQSPNNAKTFSLSDCIILLGDGEQVASAGYDMLTIISYLGQDGSDGL